ncbi:potassium/sodium efflux P-type ATPase [Poronia punctata]|nr:potassium/sodium efflux P-type ATPase [Poronia punctata]
MGSEEENALAAAKSRVSGQANVPTSRPPHALSSAQVIQELESHDINGLSSEVARQRLEELGRNEIGDSEGVSVLKIVIAQIANAMTLVLILAMAVSFGIGSYIEGAVVTLVILINVIVGFFQEYSAEKTMDSLRSLSSPTANVVRDGQSSIIPSGEVVMGDLVELKTGDTIPADLRITEAVNFETDEALLTGESLPVRKDENAVFDDDTGPGDRLNVAYSSSTVTKGRAKGIVFATGMYTEIGAIAMALREKSSKVRPVKRKPDGSAKPHRYLEAYTLTMTDAVGRFLGVNVGTPLQKKLSKLAILLFFIAVVFAIVVLAANKFSSKSEVIIYAVATGLSMIPASLVVVLTITMSAGTKRMVIRNVIVRNLKSLEALGAVTDICSDKTGTLTQGKMVARRAWVPALGTYTVGASQEPFNPTAGDISFDVRPPKELDIKKTETEGTTISKPAELLSKGGSTLSDYLRVASLANLATVSQKDGEWNARGDPTEIAIQVFASRFDQNRLKFTEGDKPEWSQITELPFDSDVKRMSVVFKQNATGELYVFTKGAVERVIGTCQDYYPQDGADPAKMTDEYREEILENMTALASMGLRVLALASKRFDGKLEKGDDIDREAVESNLTFRGLVGLYDPPRAESGPAVRSCHEAGISVHMLTGDHPETAKAIAIEVGILPSRMDRVRKDVADCMVMTASRFDALSDEQVDELPVLPLVIARCAPSTKVRMIDALHRRKRFCAMTGDGVNDSPSLKRADVGIAMGQAGSDVAKEASDVVLSDDNFASIVAAIEEGRRIFDNIQKFILHVLAENIAQALTLLVGLAFKDKTGLSVFPLAPVEIMWIICITSGAPDMGLGFERAVPDIMRRQPKSLKTGVFDAEFLVDMVVYGVWVAALCLASFSLVVYHFGKGQLGDGCNESYKDSCEVIFRARATTFSCLTWFALFLAWEMVDRRRSFFRMQPGSKRYFTQWMVDVWRNKFLFWAVIFGFVSSFPVIYIPGLNTVVFKHVGITWEWIIVIVASVLFFGGIEGWKWGKRVYFRRKEARRFAEHGVSWKDLDIEERTFAEFLDFAPGTSEAESPIEKRQ